ncbi:hypothetical protein ACP4OV_005849 [Aristida adscensionis]
MADNGWGGNHVANGGHHAAAVVANGVAENGGDPNPAPAAPVANGAVANGGNAAAAAPAVAAANGNAAAAQAVAAVHGAAMGYGGAVAPTLRLIPEHVLYLTLLRSPAAMVARFRATSRRWRDLTSTENFRRDHYLHRSLRPMPLFFFRLDHLAVPLGDRVRVHLRGVDIGRRESFEVMRFSHLDPAMPEPDPLAFRIEGSCDGVLLLSYRDRLYACNPCTRRWARLPPLHAMGDIVGFYHTPGPPGGREYRVLYHVGRRDEDCMYSILRFPDHQVRHIGRPTNLAFIDLVLATGISPSFEMPPIMVRGRLHWRPQVNQFNSYLIVFDTAAEQFRHLRPPRVFDDNRWVPIEGDQLLEINGRLAMVVVDPISVGVWVLRDYARHIWVFQYRVELPVAAIDDNHGYDEEAALSAVVLALSQQRNELVQCTHPLFQSDAMGTVLRTYQLAGHCTVLSGFMLQESLLLHAFLPLGPGDAQNGDPPFFQEP